MNGQGRPFKGRTDQEGPSNWCHQATKDEGSPKGHLTGVHFLFVCFFVQAKKSNSPFGAKPQPPWGETPNKIKINTSQKMFAFFLCSVILHYNTKE